MSNYVPHHTKKKERLANREDELLRAIHDGKSRDVLLRLAEEVRLARIRVLRAERAKLVPASKWHACNLAAFDSRLAVLAASTADAVLNEYL
jgi:hypothetical protein